MLELRLKYRTHKIVLVLKAYPPSTYMYIYLHLLAKLAEFSNTGVLLYMDRKYSLRIIHTIPYPNNCKNGQEIGSGYFKEEYIFSYAFFFLFMDIYFSSKK